jgi:3-methyladenine DNA glycosylase/8-oxoguanine DNA glycosylase
VSSDSATFAKAQRHLARRDAVLKRLIRSIGPCTLSFNQDRFAVQVQSILSQQISGKAAAAIGERLKKAFAPRGVTPASLLKTPDDVLRAAGLSAAKARALRDLAHKVRDGSVPLERIHDLEDEEVVAALVSVIGIGRWTAQMFLVFSLGRPDVLPVDDWGLRLSVQRHYELTEPPKRAQLEQLAEPWRPYRTVATWYLWRSLGTVPQSK